MKSPVGNTFNQREAAAHNLVTLKVNRLEASSVFNVNELGSLIRLQSSTLLFFDSSNDQFAEVFGDLNIAHNLAVVVPGSGQHLEHYFGAGGFRSEVNNLNVAANRIPGGGTATIAWEGYQTPNLKLWPPDISAADRGRSISAGRALAGFVEGVQTGQSLRITVIGHSYGSLVAARAVTDGLRIENFVAIGSPGLALGTRSEQDRFYNNVSNLWAAKAPGDLVAATYWYALDPYDPANGFRQFSTNSPGDPNVSGHNNYFFVNQAGVPSESLLNLADIVAGRYDPVS